MRSASKGNGKSRRAAGNGTAHKPAIVCGGAGFIGAHLCRRLLQQGHEVICVDNFCTSDEESLDELLASARFRVLRRDIASLSEDEIDAASAIFNLACAASPVHYQRTPLETLYTSVRGMDNLLRLARKTRAPIFQASTSEIPGR